MSKSHTIIAVLASLTLGGCLGGTDGPQLVDMSAYERGKSHFSAGQFGLAVKHFQSAVDREPASIEALNGLAASYDRLGRYDLSARYYERALAADPASSQTLNNIGYSYLMQDRFDLAVAYLRDAQSRDGTDPVVLANRKIAEDSYQEADLRRSTEEARDNRHAPPVSVPSQPQVAARSPARRAPVASKRRVKTWIERTAPTVQSLVTRPQTALLGAVEDVGIDPQLAAYQPQQPTAADLLPDHATAPMALDVLPSPDRREAVRREVYPASTRPEAPRASDQAWRVLMTTPATVPAPVTVVPASTADPVPMTGPAPVTDPAAVEVVVASLDPAYEMSGVVPDQDLPASVAVVEVREPEVTRRDLEPLDILDGAVFQAAAFEDAAIQVAAIQAAAIEIVAAEAAAVEATKIEAPTIEVTTVEFAAIQVAAVEATTIEATSVEATTVEVTTVEVGALEAENGSLKEDAAVEMAEVEVASLDTVVPDAPRVEVGTPVAVPASLPLVEVANGTGRLNMAARLRDHLEAEGVTVKRLTNADHYWHRETTIFYRRGWRSYAENLARMLPVAIELDDRDGQKSDIRIELGGDLLEFDRGLYYAAMRSNGDHRS